MLEVIVDPGDSKEQHYKYEQQSVMIGRAPGNDLQLDINGVSRFHARLSCEPNRVILQDLNSTNGTYVNSERVQEKVLESNDKIMIGNAIITITLKPGEIEAPNERVAESSALESVPSAVKPITVEEKKQTLEGKQVAPQDYFYWESLRGFLSPVWKYVMDDAVSEIMINSPVEIYIEQKGHLHLVPEKFSPEQLNAAVLNIAQYMGRRVTEEEPYLDARLPDGSRVAVLLPPCARKGVAIAIRKFSKERLTVNKLIEFGSISREMVTLLSALVLLKKNIIVSGGTSSGKTSLLNVVSGLIPSDERIITIEDSAELQLSQDHVLPMETRPPDKKGRGQVTIRDLVKASLRMRPDRIVVGEIRGGEALDLLQAMNTGHSGSMATVHASSPAQALTRMETLALFSGIEIPMKALREQVSSAIDIVVQASRLSDHSRKVTHISEVGQLKDDGGYVVNDIVRFESTERSEDGRILGKHEFTGFVPSCIDEMKVSGLKEALALFNVKSSK